MASVSNLDAEFLPLIYDIVRSIEKEVHDSSVASQKSREQHDYYQKIQLLKDRYEKFREQVNKVQGIELTKEEQLKRVEALSKQLVLKRELLLRYRHNCPIDAVPKI